MKKLKQLFLSFLLFSMIFQISSAQLLVESFENDDCYSILCNTSIETVIDEDECLADWSTSHGTPNISDVSPFEGEHNLYLRYFPATNGSPLTTEGAFMTSFEFLKNNCYTISFRYKVGFLAAHEPVNFNVSLSNELVHNEPNVGPCLEVAPTPTIAQQIFTEYIDLNYSDVTYQQAIIEFTPTEDFSQLWFYLDGITFPNSGYPVGISIDFIEVYNCEFICSCGPSSTQIGGIDEEGDQITTYLSDLDFEDGNFPQGCYEVQGTLIIDEDANAQNSDFVMSPGAEIIVEEGNVFFVSNCRFNGCLQLWDGITVRSGATLHFIDSKINDALHGIQAFENSTLEFKNNYLKNNHIGLYVRDGAINQIGDFENNQFVGGEDDLLLPFIDQTNFTFPVTDKPFAGILLEEVDGFYLGVENIPSFQNTFSKLKNGIVAHMCSTLEIYHCNMSDLIGAVPNPTYPFEVLRGNGIVLNECRGENKLFGNTMEELFTGVLANRSSVDILGNTMDFTRLGIKIMDAFQRKVLLQGNTINQDIGIGIHVTTSTEALEVNVINNVVNIQSPGGINGGGMLIDLTDGTEGNFNVTDNTISCITPLITYGMRISSSSYWKINQNEIVNASNFNLPVLQILGSHHLQVTDNMISGAGNGQAIDADNSSNILYCCNDVDKTDVGVKFSGACGDTKLGTTTFNTHKTELLYDPVAITGPQYRLLSGFKISYGNDWTGNNQGFDAIHEGGPFIASMSEYATLLVQGPALNNVSPLGWFTSAGPLLPTCNTWINCGEEEWFVSPPVNKLDSIIANNELKMDNEVVPWLEQQRLYEKLVQHPEFLKENRLMQSFKNSLDNDEIGLLSQVRKSLNRSSDLAKLKDFNKAIPTRSMIGLNEQTINDLEIDYYQKVSFDSKMLSQLYEIAVQCPLDAGNAVFRARSIYGHLTNKILAWEQLENCETEKEKVLARQKKSEEVAPEESLNIYPNPTSDFINIDLIMGESQTKQVRIFSIDGRAVFNQTIDTNQLQIDVTDFPNGIYTVKVMTSTSKLISKRFVVHH